jgi:bacterial/archaeal transporter family-2 protein
MTANTVIVAVIVAVLGGLSVALQGPLTSVMSQRIGVMESVFIVHLGGAIAAGLLLLVGLRSGHLDQWRSVPWYALGAGLFGLVILSAVSYTIPRLGVAVTVTLVVVVQLFLSALLDHFGLLQDQVRPFDLSRLMGLIALLVGTWLLVR